MSGLPFLAALVCIGLVIYWYFRDEGTHGGSGKSGMFRLREPSDGRKSDSPTWKPGQASKPWRPIRK